jgi:G3E family GTPase
MEVSYALRMQESDRAPGRLPLTIVTGFLGAGKTSVINRALGAERGPRLAVIVNELGRIDVDARRLRGRHGKVIELPGGCVCHQATTQDQLWAVVDEIAGAGEVDRIVLETTGIAEPHPILESLANLPPERRRVFDDGIVTVVDAANGVAQIERHVEARAQIKAADRLVVTKLDLAEQRGLPELHEVLQSLSPNAERASFPLTWEPTVQLNRYLFERPRRERERARTGVRPAHLGVPPDVVAVADDRPFVASSLLELCDRLGSRLLRAKGFVAVAGDERRAFLEKAGARSELRFEGPWPAGPRRSELVLIGTELDGANLRRQVAAAQVAH